MENELNIAAILKDKPTETKLWSPMLGDCIYCYNNTYPEEIIIAFTDKNGEEKEWTFSYSGRTISAPDTADICLFPSKQMQDWSKFAWKKGDILVNDDKNVHIIFEAFENDTYTMFKGKHYIWKEGNEEDYCKEETFLLTSVFEKVNDDAVKCYINIIEERLGGKLNLETLEIEQPKPEFKDGDILHCDETDYSVENIFIAKMHGEAIGSYAFLCLHNNKLHIADCDCDESELPAIRLATDSEQQQLFSALEKKGKRWDPVTKQIEDLPKKCEFKPMDWCLMRDKKETWKLCQFSFFDDGDYEAPYNAVGGNWFDECIPYNEETKHLLGTTDEWKG